MWIEGEGFGFCFIYKSFRLNLAPTGICMLNFAVFSSPYTPITVLMAKILGGKRTTFFFFFSFCY